MIKSKVEYQTRWVHLIQLLMHSILYLFVKHHKKCQSVYRHPVTPADPGQNLLMARAKIKYTFCQNLRPSGKLRIRKVNLGLTMYRFNLTVGTICIQMYGNLISG